ncbi:MAG: ZIP family metal transporter [Candidatus Woesearchaeota archaeon]|nr:ZIP family metal transporter [Candidatus Woesearchaeota archaeon]
MNQILILLIISATAPLLGALIGILKKPSKEFMYILLAFAAGVMLSVSFLQLMPESVRMSSIWISAVGIVVGSLLMYALDKIIPHLHPELGSQEQGGKLKKSAIYLIIGIFMHNIPEGMAIAIGAFSGLKVGFAIALSIAIHNIPEAACTSASYYYLTRKRKNSFFLASLTSISVLIGFFLLYFFYQIIPESSIGLLIGATAGIMIYISADELIPSSCSLSGSHATIFSLIAGVVIVVLLGLI